MTRHGHLGLAALAAASLLVASPSRAVAQDEDPDDKVVTDIVDFSKPPNEVAGHNKVRIAVNQEKDAKGLWIEVQGRAYYPDGVLIQLSVRHWKVSQPFARGNAKVKNQMFQHRFGPFVKNIPAGGLAVEAHFFLSAQTAAIKETLTKEKYLRRNPPSKSDAVNRTQVTISLGGADEEAAAEKAEKEQIAATLRTLTGAERTCEAELAKVEAKEASLDAAKRAVEKLQGDLKAADVALAKWQEGIQFPLFPGRVKQLATLRTKILDAAKARAVVAGVTLPDVPADRARDVMTSAAKDALKLADELKGFYEQADSLDKSWDANGNDLPPEGKPPEGKDKPAEAPKK